MDKLGGDNFLLSNSERTYKSDGGRIKKECVSATHSLKYRAKNFPALLGIETLLF